MKTDEIKNSKSEAHLLDYWKIVWQSRYTVLLILILAIVFSAISVYLSTPIYRSTAVLEIKPEARRILPGQEQWLGAEGAGWLAEEKYFNTQLEVLKSRDLASDVFGKLHLHDHPMFAEAQDPVGAFAGLIEVRPKLETRLVDLSISGPNAKDATDWVNTLADVYVQKNIDRAVMSFRKVLDQISKGLSGVRTDIGKADIETMELAAQTELYVPENQEEILSQTLQRYSTELSNLNVELASINAEIENLERIERVGGDVMTLPHVANDSIMMDLNTQKIALERDLELLAAEKKPGHPEYRQKQRELAQIDAKIMTEVSRIAEELRTQYRTNKSEVASLETQVAKTRHEAYQVRQQRSAFDMMETDANTKKRVYDIVSETMERLTVSAQLVSMNNNISVLDRAIVPKYPFKPRRVFALAMGAMFGLLLGLGTVLFLDYLDNTIRTPEEIEQYLGMNVMAVVPRDRGKDALLKEAFLSLRTSLLFSSRNRERNVILVSSAGPQEGKSSCTSNLAKSLASAGDKVMVLDCDLRRPTQHIKLEVAREPGITNYILSSEGEHYSKFTIQTSVPGLDLMPCGIIPPNPTEIVGMSRFHDLLIQLKKDYDWVLIDSPPSISLADTMILAPMADMVVLIIKHNENDKDLIRRSVMKLREINANLVGAVLNNVEIEKAYYKDYYHASYYYYADQSEKSTRRKWLPNGNSKDEKKVVL